MKNIDAYSGDTSDFLDEIIKSKRNSKKDPNYKQRVDVLSPDIKVLFNNYETAHCTNNHISLVPKGYVNQEKADLLKLYSSTNPIIKKLKKDITTALDNRAMNTCQYCTITSVSSLDHIVPKGEFPEFSVNPKNLLPACSICNSHKSEKWKENNKTIFLNPYTDILPREQYLFVKLLITDDNIQPTFELRNDNNINSTLFELLESHYSSLKLLKRFKQDSNRIITDLRNTISAYIEHLDIDSIKKATIEKIKKDKEAFGHNYYKSILEETLINNQQYLDSILSNYK